jgi:ligand-binding sensor domain-containing protein/AraC-like DNA-binding protein
MIRSVSFVAIVIFIFPIISSRVFPLDPDKSVKRYLVDRWDESTGLASNTVLSISQTPDGYLWVATAKGLVRFDGITFSTLPFTGEEDPDKKETIIPDTLFTDREGTLWIGSAAGLTAYRYKGGWFETFVHVGSSRERVRRVYVDMRGNTWISFFSSYVSRFANGEFTHFDTASGLEGKKINAIVETGSGNLLFGSRENGVFRFKDGKFSRYPVKGLENLYIITMYEDEKGTLWIGTSGGLFRVGVGSVGKYTAAHGLSNDYVTAVTEDSDHNLWVGTLKGLNRVRRIQAGSGGSITFEPLLKSLLITCLFEDREKSLWVGTYNSGLQRLKDRKFISYTPSEVFRQEILLSLLEDSRGDIWVGTLSGKLFHCRGTEVLETLEIKEISGTGIAAIAEDSRGNLWLGTNGKGILQKKGTAFVRFSTREGLADNLVTSITVDSRGNLWFSTFDGVSVIRSSSRTIESLNSGSGLLGKAVHNVYEDRSGHIWVAADKGINVLKDGIIEKENIIHLLQGVSVTAVYQDPVETKTGETVTWVATHGAGLKRIKSGIDGTNAAVTSFTTAEGLASNFIYQFFEDFQGNFWFMSNNGVLRVNKKELNLFAQNGTGEINCTSFGVSDGMESSEFNNEFSHSSAIKTGSGELRFITKKGISIVNPAKIQINKTPPPVVVESVFFNDRPVPLRTPGQVEHYKGIRRLRFHFTAPTFLSPAKIRFKYRLEGVDKDWVTLPPGQERLASYRDLPTGTYTFNVTACNSEGVWNRTGDSVTFTLELYFHQTFLFKAILLLAALLLAAALFFVYRRQAAARKAKYKTSHINPRFAEECVKKLRFLMEMEKVFCDPDISLPLLAEKLSISSHQLSQILNETLKHKFSDYINSYRIDEAKRILQSRKGSHQKITSIAFDVGFNTTVAFYTAFKKYTGMTPAQYKKTTGDEE